MITIESVRKSAEFAGHREPVYSIVPGSQTGSFFSAGGDGMIVKWQTDSPEEGLLIARVNHSVYALHFLDDRNALLVAENFEGIHLINMENNDRIASISLSETPVFDLKSNKEALFVACGNGILRKLHLASLQTEQSVKLSDKSIRCLAIQTSRGELAVGGSDNQIRILDSETLEVIKEISGHRLSVFTLCYSPDGKYLISGSRDAHFKVWDVEKGYLLHESVAAHLYAINHLIFSPDGKLFATCSMDKSIKIWEYSSLKLLKVLDKSRHAGHGTSVNKLLWMAHNNLLISCSDDRSLSAWDIRYAQGD